jgi:hypothetical protein
VLGIVPSQNLQMNKPRSEQRRVWLLIAALPCALVATGLVTVVSYFIKSGDGTYGAPIPVGRSCFGGFLFPDPRCEIDVSSGTVVDTFDWVLFAVDVLFNWILWFVLARWSGFLGIVAGTIGALVSILLIPVMLSFELRVVGLPIPLLPWTAIPNPVVIWLDILAWAATAAALTRIGRRHPI